MMGEIYKVTNTHTGEIYIGATRKSINERKIDHIQKASNGVGGHFQQAIGTYGPEAFSWEQIDTAENLNDLAEKETYYIIHYKSKENGYNENRGGGFKKTIYQYFRWAACAKL
jgi:group I intron endonuclease